MLKLARAFTVISMLLVSAPAYADHAKPADLTTEDQAELAGIEAYLNGLHTVRSHFTQVGTNGVSSGTFYLDRPGRLRFDYESPQKDIIVADRKLIWYYDAKMKEANHAPISRTFADFLLRREIQLAGNDVTVTDFQHGDNAVQLTMTQTDDPGQGSLTLVLSEKPLRIQQWRVIDPQGRTTQVTLQDPEFGIAFDPALFVWRDPEDNR